MATMHGHARRGQFSPEYRSWASMKNRCLNKNGARWREWGGRGISICRRWMDFEKFLADMGPRPSLAYSIERRDNDGNYTPKNCYWGTAKDQGRNQKKTIRVRYKGRTMSLTAACELAGVIPGTARSRIYDGFPFDQPRPR